MHADLEPLLKAFPGRVGCYARHLDSGESFAWDAETPLPTASAAKVFVLATWAQDVVEGRLDPETRRTVRQEDVVRGSGVLRFCRPGLAPTLSDLAHLMMTVSDNVATNLVLDVVGGPRAVTARMAALGLEGAEVLNPIQFEDLSVLFGRATARALAETFALFAEPGRHGYPAAAARLCLDILRRNEHLSGLPRHLPWSQHAVDFQVELPVTVYGKTGSMPHVQTDAGLFVTPAGSWVLAILCEGFEDLRAGAAGTASTLHAEVGRLVYEAWR